MILPLLELVLLGAVLAFLIAYGLGGWVAVFATGLVLLIPVSVKSARMKCPHCGKRPITVRGLRFCGQCGAAVQKLRLGIWCRACHRIARSELSVHYCNRCGK